MNWNCSKEKIPEIILPYYRIRDELFIWNGNCIARGERAVIPKNLQSRILEMVHGLCHMGIVKLKQKLRQNVYWPMIDRDAELFVKDCVPCSDSDIPKGPWLDLGIDIMGPFN